MASIYGRLGFDSTNPISNAAVENYNSNVNSQMAMIPTGTWLNEWQTKDVAEANTGGYFQNPLVSTLTNVYIVANTMIEMANGSSIDGSTITITDLLSNTKIKAISIGYSNTENQIVSECDSFLYHTNRLSNVIEPDRNINLPHYQTATGYGTLMCYITNQSDGVQNNSPMMGSFTSLYTQNTLDAAVAITSNLLIVLQSSITRSSYVFNGNTYYDYNSTISLTDAQNLYANMNLIFTTMNGSRTRDTVFFQNSKAVMDDYSKASQFSKLGQSENQLIQERIGSPKLLSRLNANT